MEANDEIYFSLIFGRSGLQNFAKFSGKIRFLSFLTRNDSETTLATPSPLTNSETAGEKERGEHKGTTPITLGVNGFVLVKPTS